MATPLQIVAASRMELDTPFQHQGRLSKVGLDCIGEIVLTARACAIPIEDRMVYSKVPRPEQLLAELDRQLDRTVELNVGNVVAFWFIGPTMPQHVGILTPHRTGLGLIHTYKGAGKVIEHVLDETWRRRIYGVWRFRGVA